MTCGCTDEDAAEVAFCVGQRQGLDRRCGPRRARSATSPDIVTLETLLFGIPCRSTAAEVDSEADDEHDPHARSPRRGRQPRAVQASLPVDSDVQIVGIVDGLEDSWATLQETPTDLLVVACAGYSDRARLPDRRRGEAAPGSARGRACDGSPNGSCGRVFEAGADDILTLPRAPSDSWLHAPEGGRPKAGRRRREGLRSRR